MQRNIDDVTRQSAPAAPRESVPMPVEHEHIHLSPQSVWPITAAAGIALSGAGFVTTFFITFGGVLILIYAIVMWIQELRHEPQ